MKRFLEREFDQFPEGYARFHVIPVPLDSPSTNDSRVADGPAAILEASNSIEVFDGMSTPGEDGIYTCPSVDSSGRSNEVAQRISDAVERSLTSGKESPPVPVLLGGDHPLTVPAIGAVQRFYAHTGEIGIVYFDARSDLRYEFEERTDLHPSVARRIHEDMGIPLVQVGTRRVSPEEMIYRSANGPESITPIVSSDAKELVIDRVSHIELPDSVPERVYLSIDLSVFDPAILPAIENPVPGGLGWYQVLALIESVASQRTIVAVDIVGLSPQETHVASEVAAAELAYKTMGCISRSRST